MSKKILFSLIFLVNLINAQQVVDPFKPDTNPAKEIHGYKLIMNEDFNSEGVPDSKWSYEKGFVRNEELQWYQASNSFCSNGSLKIEGRREQVLNPNYVEGSTDWKKNRQYAQYTSSCIKTNESWLFGRFEVRAKIPTVKGSWPAIWTYGTTKPWPSGGEIDLLELYKIDGTTTILANFAWGTSKQFVAKWKSSTKPLSYFINKDQNWASKFHIWRMDWNKDIINLYLDDELLNSIDLSLSINADGSNAFHKPQWLLLNLALG